LTAFLQHSPTTSFTRGRRNAKAGDLVKLKLTKSDGQEVTLESQHSGTSECAQRLDCGRFTRIVGADQDGEPTTVPTVRNSKLDLLPLGEPAEAKNLNRLKHRPIRTHATVNLKGRQCPKSATRARRLSC